MISEEHRLKVLENGLAS